MIDEYDIPWDSSGLSPEERIGNVLKVLHNEVHGRPYPGRMQAIVGCVDNLVQEWSELVQGSARHSIPVPETGETLTPREVKILRLVAALETLEPSARALLDQVPDATAAWRNRWRYAIEQARTVVRALDSVRQAGDDPL